MIDNICEKISAKRSQAYLNFGNKLDYYENLFSLDDECPDISHFKNYEEMPISKLLLLEKQLDIWTAHQKGIIALKERYERSFESALNHGDVDKVSNCDLKEIYPYNHGGMSNKESLEKCCKIFLENSENVQESIKAFKNTSKDLFKLCKDIIEDIFEFQNNKWFKMAERLPLIGIIPKSVRIIDQINLTRCLKGNYKDFTRFYIKNGIQNTMLQYGEQYKYIESLAQEYQNKANKMEENYINQLLQKVQKVKNSQVKSYSKLFNNYNKTGCYINSICNRVRTRGAVAFAKKAVVLMA